MKSCVLHVPDSYGSQACVACLYSTEWISYTTRLYSTARPARASCFVLRGNLVLSFEYLRHHTRLRTRLFCPSWIHAITQYSEQCFVPHGFTPSHNIQNNVDLFFTVSRHQAIIRTTIMRHCLTTSRDRRNNVVLSFVASWYHTIVWTTLFYSSQLHDMVRS